MQCVRRLLATLLIQRKPRRELDAALLGPATDLVQVVQALRVECNRHCHLPIWRMLESAVSRHSRGAAAGWLCLLELQDGGQHYSLRPSLHNVDRGRYVPAVALLAVVQQPNTVRSQLMHLQQHHRRLLAASVQRNGSELMPEQSGMYL